nr:MAG TPA: peroxiredoxin [Caudoviricetes sp.]
MQITIYTTNTCPKCQILKKKLKEKNIPFLEETDVNKMLELDILAVPQMKVDNGKLMNFEQAVQWVNKQEA